MNLTASVGRQRLNWGNVLMKKLKTWIAGSLAAVMLTCFTNAAHAEDPCYDAGGCGYEECRRCPSLAPAVALGTIAIVAIVAVVLQNSGGVSSHSHSGSSSSS